MEQLTELLVVFFAGTILLAPVAALSARFALKPLIQLLSRKLGSDQVEAQLAAQARRLELLENELQSTQESLKALAAGAEFERRLAAESRGEERP